MLPITLRTRWIPAAATPDASAAMALRPTLGSPRPRIQRFRRTTPPDTDAEATRVRIRYWEPTALSRAMDWSSFSFEAGACGTPSARSYR